MVKKAKSEASRLMSFRCIALDAEKSALAELSYLLNNDPRVNQVIATSETEQASSALKQERIDAVFVCLIHHSVEQVNELLAPYASHTKFVALSRKPEDAFGAFEFGAIDYILKPINKHNIERAMVRLENHFVPSSTNPTTKIRVEHNGITYFVNSNEVFYIQANGDYSIVTTARGDFVAKTSLSKLAESLSESGFDRVHRQWLVQLERVDAIVHECGGMNLLVAGRQVPVSRRCARIVRQKLG